ncbi:MAG: hypothetical protein ACKVON_09430 [Beijerinckiaceae bacterium]
MVRIALGFSALILGFAAVQSARAQQPNYDSWAPLVNPFESTSGGGVMIDGYKPVVGEKDGKKVCTTDFSVRVPGEKELFSEIVFEAVSIQGGILCTKGKWRMKDGSGDGTTPFEVFIKDGKQLRSP